MVISMSRCPKKDISYANFGTIAGSYFYVLLIFAHVPNLGINKIKARAISPCLKSAANCVLKTPFSAWEVLTVFRTTRLGAIMTS